MSQDRLGLNDDDYNAIIHNVNIIIHSAACVKFDKPLLEMIDTNFLGTYRMLELAKSCVKLECFNFISTAYSQFNNTGKTEEKFYPCFVDPMKIMDICRRVDNEQLDFLTKKYE